MARKIVGNNLDPFYPVNLEACTLNRYSIIPSAGLLAWA